MNDKAITKTEEPRPETFSTPAVDIFESDSELLLKADLPGVTKEGIDLRFEEDTLQLKARHAQADHVYRRTFSLEQRYDADGIVAKLDAGVLTVHLPKAAHVRPREIRIQ